MPISSYFQGERCQLRIDGPLTIYEANESKAHLLQELGLAREMEVDLAGVSEFDTAGVQLLLLLKREAARHGKAIGFHGHSRAVLQVIDLYNMAGVFGDPLVLSDGERP
ncbi:STAS domain-containing protein [Chitinimonas lacunae]|uniref:Lipid asymmetry maintenance protein MlaB n=1 Tax=Chitinimonas lacunae TaxID=1963018 RepID=A0ABV8MNC5_9NEIS